MYEIALKEAQSTPQNFNGCVQPLLYLTLIFKDRFKGYRVTPTTKVRSIDGTSKKEVKLSTYGFAPQHVIFLEGMKCAPFITSSLAQTVGIGTILYNLITSPAAYSMRWKNAALKQLKHLPGTPDIIEFLANKKPSEVQTVMKELLDLILILTPRQTNRAAFPVCMLSHIMLSAKPSYKDFAKDANEKAVVLTVKNKLAFIDRTLAEFNSSGLIAAAAFNEASKNKFSIPGKIEEDKAISLSIMALFGCAKEDLGVLKEMFGGRRFYKRSELGKSFVQQGKSNSVTPMSFPVLMHYSKLAQSAQSGFNFGQTAQQVSSVPTFSGKRKRHYSGELMALLETRSAQKYGGRTQESIVDNLQHLKMLAREKIKDISLTGTQSWHSLQEEGMGVITFTPNPGKIITESGEFFFT